MWIGVVHGYINTDTIEYVENKSSNGNTVIVIHMISGNRFEVTGTLALNVLEYVRQNQVYFVTKLTQPIGLDGLSLS